MGFQPGRHVCHCRCVDKPAVDVNRLARAVYNVSIYTDLLTSLA